MKQVTEEQNGQIMFHNRNLDARSAASTQTEPIPQCCYLETSMQCEQDIIQ